MRGIIIYYSYSGNTKEVSEILSEYLKQKGEIEMLELKAQDESESFFGQCNRAFWHKKAEIMPVNLDLSNYDIICFGTPVWAFGPGPAMNTYLEQCKGVNDKDIIIFTTYGSGTGNNRCLNYMQDVLSRKGAKNFQRFSIQQLKVHNRNFVTSKIKEALGLRIGVAS